MKLRHLGEVERDRVWRSTFSGAHYRWAVDQWEVKTAVADWHPIKPGQKTTFVNAGATEYFEEVS